MYYNIFDSHTHSHNSHDAKPTVEAMCLAAIEKGVKGFALTDHCEVNLYTGDYIIPVQHSFDELCEIREKYQSKLQISAGIELGQANYDTKLAKEIITKNKYDHVIASTHGLGDKGDVCLLNFATMSNQEVEELVESYFSYYLDMVTVSDFDTAAHLTYPIRYIVGNYGIQVDLKKYDELISEILRTIAQRGKALEMNTSGLRQKIGIPFPTEDYVKRFLDFGGTYVTLGSDAHRTDDIAADFQHCLALLESIGLKSYTFFSKRNPQQIKIG